MPSANEIENQNNLLLDQRDIMEEVANLFEDAAISGEMNKNLIIYLKMLKNKLLK